MEITFQWETPLRDFEITMLMFWEKNGTSKTGRFIYPVLHIETMDAYPVGDNVVVTDQTYQNYEFYVEWKVASCGNSGIIYNVIEDDQYGEAYLTGPEMQILDNSSHTDGQYLAHRAGDLYDMIPAAFVTANGPNDWNRVRLIVKEGHVEHWLNGYKLLEFDMWDDMWDERIKNSKFKEMPAFGTGRSGHIVLQDHRDEVWFRNIKIRSL